MLCCIFGVGIYVTDAIGVYTVCCTFLKTVMVVASCERIPRRRCSVILRYESSTLILYKELSSTFFQSCLSVRHR